MRQSSLHYNEKDNPILDANSHRTALLPRATPENYQNSNQYEDSAQVELEDANDAAWGEQHRDAAWHNDANYSLIRAGYGRARNFEIISNFWDQVRQPGEDVEEFHRQQQRALYAPQRNYENNLSFWGRGPQGNRQTRENYAVWENTFRKGSMYDLGLGPMIPRVATNSAYLLIFGIAWILYLIFSARSMIEGNPWRLTRGADHMGRVCGIDKEVRGFPLLYFPSKLPPNSPQDSELAQSDLIAVCTSKCPREFSDTNRPGGCAPDESEGGFCTWYGAKPTMMILKRFCLFSHTASSSSPYVALMSFHWKYWLGDALISWPVILLSPFAAVLLCLIYFWFMMKAIHVIIWILLVVSDFALFGLGLFFFLESKEPTYVANIMPEQLNIFMAIFLWISAALYLLLIALWRRQITLSAYVLKTAAKFLSQVPHVLLVALVFSSLMLSFIIFGCWSFLSGLSTIPRQANYAWSDLDAACTVWLVLNFVFFLWNIDFLVAVEDMIISHSVASWYFAPVFPGGRRHLLYHSVADSCWVILRYHLGSAVFGSFILSVLALPRAVSWLRQSVLSRRSDSIVLPFNCLSFFSWYGFFFRLTQFLTRKAYIQVAFLGQDFLKAAYTSFALSVRNPIRIFLVESFSIMVQIIGVLSVTSCMLLVVLGIMKYFPAIIGATYLYTSPLVFACLTTLPITIVLMQCWSISCDAIIQCYLIDEEMAENEGRMIPEHIPSTLLPFRRLQISGPRYFTL